MNGMQEALAEAERGKKERRQLLYDFMKVLLSEGPVVDEFVSELQDVFEHKQDMRYIQMMSPYSRCSDMMQAIAKKWELEP